MSKFKLTIDTDTINMENEIHINISVHQSMKIILLAHLLDRGRKNMIDI